MSDLSCFRRVRKLNNIMMCSRSWRGTDKTSGTCRKCVESTFLTKLIPKYLVSFTKYVFQLSVAKFPHETFKGVTGSFCDQFQLSPKCFTGFLVLPE